MRRRNSLAFQERAGVRSPHLQIFKFRRRYYFRNMKSTHTAFWLLTLGTIIALALPRVLKDGMFTDGVLYASVAHNLAIGKGSFWYPYFDKYMFPFFHQQPPLTFGIQALFYKWFGDSYYVERVYSFATALISALLIAAIWREIYKGHTYKAHSWLPVLCWIIIPVCFWAYSNNMEENTMGIFTLLSVWCIYKGLTANSYGLYIILGSLFIVPAALCKGFPGMFPLAMPLLYIGVVKPGYSLGKAVMLITTPLLINAILFTLLIETHPSLIAYLNDRVLNSIQKVSNVDNRFYLLIQLFTIELIVPAILAAIIVLWAGKASSVTLSQPVPNARGSKCLQFKELTIQDRRNILFWFLVGISASFPLIVTREQRIFYLATSLPYFAIAIALVAVPYAHVLLQKINTEARGFTLFKTLMVLYVIIGLGVSYLSLGQTGRDKEKLHDVYAIGKLIGNNADIKTSAQTWTDWSLHNYFVRYYNISLASDSSTGCTYYMVNKLTKEEPPKNYTSLQYQGEVFDLYRK